jgi:O-acetyl-ADP-ribose deacetylase (regulator of RNase III)
MRVAFHLTGGLKSLIHNVVIFSKHVIHAVGSSTQHDIKTAQLSACYSNSLELSLEHNLTSVVGLLA